MKYLALIISVLYLSGCKDQPKADISVLLETDKAFAAFARDSGTGKAFIAYAAEDVVKMNDNSAPIFGKAELTEVYGKMSEETAPLVWKPLKAEISSGGDLGYTFGSWTWNFEVADGIDTTYNGVYVTIWKKQEDGTWKYVLDGGNVTPPASEWPKATP